LSTAIIPRKHASKETENRVKATPKITGTPSNQPGPLEMTEFRDGEISVNASAPEILAKGLDVVFCGINLASSAASAGHNFSSTSNRFWKAIYLAGFTAECLKPQDENLLLNYGCGITAVVHRPTKKATDVLPEEFRQARLGFEFKMRHYAPRSVAFLGKRALLAMTGWPSVNWGRLPVDFAGALGWVLPNPSGLNRGFKLDALVRAYKELQIFLSAEPTSAHSARASSE
jgi:double-stranded uracil-DNA glycosylase